MATLHSKSYRYLSRSVASASHFSRFSIVHYSTQDIFSTR